MDDWKAGEYLLRAGARRCVLPLGVAFAFWRFVFSELYGTADIFRGIMVSLYVKGKENGHVQAYAPTGAMVLK